AAETARHLARVLTGGEWAGAKARPVGPAGHEIEVPPALDVGHEAHFAELLDELLGWIDTGHRPAALATRTLAKYTLLAEAAAVTARDEVAGR
ncbi:MAG: putative oxidoreductase C-terminal domain-containing protein, partial [Candidatus Rokuibacteriota bacterium]